MYISERIILKFSMALKWQSQHESTRDFDYGALGVDVGNRPRGNGNTAFLGCHSLSVTAVDDASDLHVSELPLLRSERMSLLYSFVEMVT